jgi:predicted ArsR family transcriptional regulator
LLEVAYRNLSGRTGPGSGRPAKVYRRSAREFAVSLPERQYDLLSQILARAVVEATKVGEPVAPIAAVVARDAGHAHGATHNTRTEHAATDDADSRRGPTSDLRVLADALVPLGYEPAAEPGLLTLRNCPFHKTAQEQAELVCGLNLEFVAGVCDGLGCSALAPELQPDPGRCCVTVRSEATP